MAAAEKPNVGVVEGWIAHDDGWGDPMNRNFVIVDALLFLAVKSMALATPPSSPAEGDRYIIATSPTGAWSAATPGQIAAYYDSTWLFFTPKEGWIAKLIGGSSYEYNGTAWVGQSGGGGIPDAPSDDKIYARKDGAWIEIDFIAEAPEDGKQYARKNGAWVEVAASGGGSLVTLSDVSVSNVASSNGLLLGYQNSKAKWVGYKLRLTASPAVTTTWDPSFKGSALSLSSSNSTAQNPAGSTYGGVLGTVKLSVDTYFEIAIDPSSQSVFASTAWGVATRAANLNSDIKPQAANVIACDYTSAGGMYQNGSAIASAFLGAPGAGATICVAFKASTREVWIRIFDGTTLNPWNGVNTADPATGVGGIAVGGTDDCYPFFGTQLNAMISIIHHSSFTQPVPAGFVGYDPGAPDAIPGDVVIANPQDGDVLTYDAATKTIKNKPPAGGSSGTVTSVGISPPSGMTVSGSPVTSAGTLTLSWAAQAANMAFMGPASGANAAPTWRSIVAADLPVMGASGSNHAAGIVPDPGSTAGTSKYLREDGTWSTPPAASVMGASGASHAAGLAPDPGSTSGTSRFLREDATWATPPTGSSSQAQVYVGTPGSPVNTFDPSRLGNNSGSTWTLTNSNMRAVASSGANDRTAQTTVNASLTKTYFEMTPTGTFGTDTEIGLGTQSISLITELGFATAGSISLNSNGNIYNGNSTAANSTAIPYSSGSVIGVAYDPATRNTWFRVGTGNWNGSATANPATGVGGIVANGSGDMYPAVGTSNTAVAFTVAFSGFVNAAPSGFSGASTTPGVKLADSGVGTPTAQQFFVYDGSKWNSRAILATDMPVMVASGSTHASGAVPDPGATAGTTKFLREDATWTVPPYPLTMVASGTNHAGGLVPDPGSTSGTAKFLREDATWATPAAASVMGASGSNHAAGLAPDPGSTAGSTKYLREDATWATPPSALAALTDTNISSPTSAQYLSYASGSGKWVNTSFTGSTIPTFVKSGTGHAPGAVPDPGASAGTTRFLREDATWGTPAGTTTLAAMTDVSISTQTSGQFLMWSSGSSRWVNSTFTGNTIPTFVASGGAHAPGAVPDPGISAGTTKFLREDATWAVPPTPPVMVASGSSHASGLTPDTGATAGATRYLREDGTWAAALDIIPGFTDGNFDSWSVGTSFSLSTSGVTFAYTADMWVAGCGDGAITVARGTRTNGSAPSYTMGCSKYTANVTINTATTSNPVLFGGRIEGVDKLAGMDVTISASMSASTPSNITGIQITQVFGSGGSPSSNVVSTTSVSWAVSTTEGKLSAKVTIPSISGKTIGSNGGDFTQICFVFANGTTGTVRFSQVQLDTCPATAPATTGAPQNFRYAGPALEKKKVERYLASLVYPASTNFIGGGATSSTELYGWGPSGVSMYRTPAVSVVGGTIQSYQAGGSFTPSGAASVSGNTPSSLQFYSVGTGAVVGGFGWFYSSGAVTLILDARL